MGDDETTATPSRGAEKAAARGTQSNPENVPEEIRYSYDELFEGARGLLKVSRYAVAGALGGLSQKTFTLEEASKLVNTALKREHEA
jgi:hypothetical protein